MSTPGATGGPSEAAVRAHRLRRAGRLEAARACAGASLQQLRAAVDAGGLPALPAWAEMVALDAGIAIDSGRFEGLAERLEEARRELLAAAGTDGAAVQLAMARLQLEAGRLHAAQQHLAPACEHLAGALAVPPRRTLEGEAGACVRIRALAGLGAVLCMHARHAEGLPRLEQALAESEALPVESVRYERARILIGLSAAHFEQHRLDEAQRRIEQARSTLLPLVHARRAGARADLGRVGINLGSIHSRAGRLEAAVQAYRGAIDELDRAARTVAHGGDALRLRATRAKASMNLGYTLFKAGDFDAAQRHLAIALRRYGPLLQSRPELRADLARTRVNAAHLAARRGAAGRAAALYARGLRDFETIMREAGTAHLAADAANARLGLARAALLRGQARRSARLFTAALATLRDLTREGALHHAHAWLRAWVEQASLLLGTTLAPAQVEVVLAALLQALRQPPPRALGRHEEPLRGLAAALDAVQAWSTAAPPDAARGAAAQALATAGLRYLLDATAQVLSDSAPDWLAGHQATVQAWVRRLGEAAAAVPGAPRLLAQWFLCTRGLRAQRVALADGTDPRVGALRAALDELNRLESDLLGGTCPGDADDLLGLTDAAPAQAESAGPAVRWQALRDEVGRRVDAAVRQGLLPPVLHLAASEVARALAPHQAVLFLARLDRTRVLAVALCGTPGNATARHRLVRLPDSADAPCDLLNAAARQALRHDFGAQPSRDPRSHEPRRIDLEAARAPAPGDRLALAALRALAEDAVAPTLRELQAAGSSEIAIVPADDLHLLPWGVLLRGWTAPALSVAVYPNAGAWWRCRTLGPDAAGALPRWGQVCAPRAAGAAPLRWAEIEQRQSQRLWGAPAEGPPDALLVVGHGELPRGNPALAGLRLDDGRVLGAHEVASGGAVRRVLLSCCMLGRTDEAFGEPLGFLSTCFAYRAHFGIGWLTEVPDEAACLFSLALQFALRAELRSGRATPSWHRVFHATCASIERGVWPEGFVDWLGDAAGEPGRPGPAVPPEPLRRVLPWVVALGA
ncbi:MAG: hypothetical protein KF788_17275 [Piscinibacter sp.]|nr:hypothetical protein [Piscinibacter sp.]